MCIRDRSKVQRSTSITGTPKTVRHELYQQVQASGSDLNNLNEESSLFIPKINERSQRMKRDRSVDQILYSDASRRIKERAAANETPIATARQPNIGSQRVIAERLLREVESIVASDGIQILDLSGLLSVLKTLQFVSPGLALEDVEASPFHAQEKVLVLDIWNALKGQKYNGITIRNLVTFLLAILGIQSNILRNTIFNLKGSEIQAQTSRIKGEHEVSIEENSNDLIQIGIFDKEGVLHLTPEEVAAIQTTFDLFYINRLRATSKRSKSRSSDLKLSFHPIISEVSETMAREHKEKLISKLEGVVSTTELSSIVSCKANLLCLDQSLREKAFKEKSAAVIAERSRECTFQPRINAAETTLSQTPRSRRKASISRTEDLYRKAKPPKSRVDRDRGLIEFERNREECTFTPVIKELDKSKVLEGRSPFVVRDVNKSISRLRGAKEQKELTSAMREKGTPFNHKTLRNIAKKLKTRPSVSANMGENDIPLLHVDVNISKGIVKRLTIMPGDSLEKVSKEFARQHNLGEEMQGKLKELLSSQFINLGVKML
eukprot:TRINITY_DN2570_c0_g1_i3.p1 TRINITY_DN2570_c0_g1~~TRINITY_DN2570_c0_g1_i3.p1  ORF type:complete len:569 (+),score=105.27 TRINITY_DN2570_c0_g1_i3:61-1707(+)